MKTIKHFTFFLLFLTLFCSACKKEEHHIQQDNNPDSKINRMVSEFREKLTSHLKSDEVFSTDSALWYISTTLNATYANAYNDGNTPDITHFDSVKIDLPANTGTLTIGQVNVLYETIVDSVRGVYNKIDETDKQLAAVIFEPQEGNTSNELDVKIITYSTWGLHYWEVFGPSESYYWAITDDYGTPVAPNAPNKFKEKFTKHVIGEATVPSHPGYYWVFTEQQSVYLYEDYPYNYNSLIYPPYTNYLDFYLFTNFVNYPGYHTVLCADELNFYFSKIIEFADVIVPQKYNIPITATHRCYEINVGCARTYCGLNLPENMTSIRHSVIFYYGNRQTLPTGYPIPL